jgi:hypothetical protein
LVDLKKLLKTVGIPNNETTPKALRGQKIKISHPRDLTPGRSLGIQRVVPLLRADSL